MGRFAFSIGHALPLLCLLFTSCADDVPELLTQADVEEMLRPVLISSDPPEGTTVPPISQITFTFNKPVSGVTVNGKAAEISGDSAQVTYQGDLGDGNLSVEWEWPHGTFQQTLSFVIDPLFNAKIAFMSRRDGNAEVYVMNVDGTSPVNLTDHPEDDRAPTWSPDGTKIAFSSNRHGTEEIYVMNADGTSLIRLTNNAVLDSWPSWSPDGTKIAFSSDLDIYMMNPDSTNLRRLTQNPASDWAPSWSPHGTKIAFVSDRDGNAEIYVMNADGTNPANLTNNPSNDQMPSWSPDGTRIAFVSDFEIHVMNADGTNPIRLTNDPARNASPSWSADGTKIAFVSDLDIHVINVDSTKPDAPDLLPSSARLGTVLVTVPEVTLVTWDFQP